MVGRDTIHRQICHLLSQWPSLESSAGETAGQNPLNGCVRTNNPELLSERGQDVLTTLMAHCLVNVLNDELSDMRLCWQDSRVLGFKRPAQASADSQYVLL